jgi:Serine aminopeptidase, S33
MAPKVVCAELSLPWFKVHALVFLPSPGNEKKEWAIFTHGYTSHKGDCLNWATRLVENGVPTIIFDQPGHYLGSFFEISSWEDFKDHVHELFAEAFKKLQELTGTTPVSLIFGGHSLGAFTAIKAMELPLFQTINRVGVAVGFGIGQRQATHLFETAFYEKTLSVRRQLVSPHLDSKIVFGWLKEAKEHFAVAGQRIHLITGEDDIVVGKGGLEAIQEILEANNNVVTVDRPTKLPHHEPGMATPHMYAFLKDHFGWSKTP